LFQSFGTKDLRTNRLFRAGMNRGCARRASHRLVLFRQGAKAIQESFIARCAVGALGLRMRLALAEVECSLIVQELPRPAVHAFGRLGPNRLAAHDSTSAPQREVRRLLALRYEELGMDSGRESLRDIPGSRASRRSPRNLERPPQGRCRQPFPFSSSLMWLGLVSQVRIGWCSNGQGTESAITLMIECASAGTPDT
jgi:hypothetical protein